MTTEGELNKVFQVTLAVTTKGLGCLLPIFSELEWCIPPEGFPNSAGGESRPWAVPCKTQAHEKNVKRMHYHFFLVEIQPFFVFQSYSGYFVQRNQQRTKETYLDSLFAKMSWKTPTQAPLLPSQ